MAFHALNLQNNALFCKVKHKNNALFLQFFWYYERIHRLMRGSSSPNES